MPLVDNKTINTYKEVMKQLRKDLGRTITIYCPPTTATCNNCIYDTRTKTSSGVYKPDTGTQLFSEGALCPVCSGHGKIETAVTKVISHATIRWLDNRDRYFYEEKMGQFQPGWVRIQCTLSEVLKDKSNVNGLTYFDEAVKVTVDGEDCRVKSVTKSGLKDLFTCRVMMRKLSMDTD